MTLVGIGNHTGIDDEASVRLRRLVHHIDFDGHTDQRVDGRYGHAQMVGQVLSFIDWATGQGQPVASSGTISWQLVGSGDSQSGGGHNGGQAASVLNCNLEPNFK